MFEAPGRINFPSCDLCEVDTSCNGHAVSVTTDETQENCICTCSGSWDASSDCSVCPDIYEIRTLEVSKSSGI